jgi:hypothetical protein
VTCAVEEEERRMIMLIAFCCVVFSTAEKTISNHLADIFQAFEV